MIFVGALTGLCILGLYKLLKYARLSPLPNLLISCTIVWIGLAVLTDKNSIGSNLYYLEQVWIMIWFVVGMIKTRPKPDRGANLPPPNF